MFKSKQTGDSSVQAARITKKVAYRVLERLNSTNQISPSGKAYTMPMVRNWLYDRSRDSKIEAAYLHVIAQPDFVSSEQSQEKRKMALMHLEMAEKILSEI